MPIVDMPVAELRQYKGSTPRPADFDAYWDRALAELDRASLELELVPADFTSTALNATTCTTPALAARGFTASS